MVASLRERRAVLTAALGFLRLRPEPPEVVPLRRWLDAWAGVGAVVDGMARQGFDLALARHGAAAPSWRALFYPTSFLHGLARRVRVGDNWKAVQDAAWQALSAPPHRDLPVIEATPP